MPFCPKCKSLMLPKDGVLVCPKCGDNVKAKKRSKRILTAETKAKETVVLDSSIDDIRPKTRALCSKCGNNQAYFKILQTRRSDEPPTRIYECVKCGYSWREY